MSERWVKWKTEAHDRKHSSGAGSFIITRLLRSANAEPPVLDPCQVRVYVSAHEPPLYALCPQALSSTYAKSTLSLAPITLYTPF